MTPEIRAREALLIVLSIHACKLRVYKDSLLYKFKIKIIIDVNRVRLEHLTLLKNPVMENNHAFRVRKKQ